MKNNLVKPSILPGFMELLPSKQIAFNKILKTIEENYIKHGFLPIDTPVIEKSEVLLAKGGGDTEKQIYRFNKGDNDLSLRFDLTVPLARYVSQHISELTFPFRRYQIGKVYRGERNQKGRFREFYQCDIDVIGNGKLNIINDAEIPSIIYSIFKDLGFEAFKININNRKILNGFFDSYGINDKTEVLRVVDKLDKIGFDAVKDELLELLKDSNTVNKIIEFISIEGSNEKILRDLESLNIDNEEFKTGLKELSTVTSYIKSFGVPENNYVINLKIARGLDYYTGTVYETILDGYEKIGSVCSGGRYDNLAGYYTQEKLPGVGISIGLTRLFYQLSEAGILPDEGTLSLTKALIIPLSDESIDYSIKVSKELRDNNIVSEVYVEDGKLGKKISYADKSGIPYVILIGEDEIKEEVLTLKNLKASTQEKLTIKEIIKKL